MSYVSNSAKIANTNAYSNVGVYPTTNAAVDSLSSTPGSNGASKITGECISFSEPVFKNVAGNASVAFETPVWYNWNVTNYVKINEAYSFVLAHKGSGIAAQFGSLQAVVENRPYLYITVIDGLDIIGYEDIADEIDNPSWFGDKMSDDGVHPSTIGQEYYGEKLTNILKGYGY